MHAKAEKGMDYFAPDSQIAIKTCLELYRKFNSKILNNEMPADYRYSLSLREKFVIFTHEKILKLNTIYENQKIIIIAGIGGLSLGPLLSNDNFEVEIFESEPTLGGRANIIKENGFTFDTGPSLLNYPWVYEEYFSIFGKKFL